MELNVMDKGVGGKENEEVVEVMFLMEKVVNNLYLEMMEEKKVKVEGVDVCENVGDNGGGIKFKIKCKRWKKNKNKILSEDFVVVVLVDFICDVMEFNCDGIIFCDLMKVFDNCVDKLIIVEFEGIKS